MALTGREHDESGLGLGSGPTRDHQTRRYQPRAKTWLDLGSAGLAPENRE